MAKPPSAESVLHKIFAKRQEALAALNSNEAWYAGIREDSQWPVQPPRRFREAFAKETAGASHRVIAEVKRASPSKGLFAAQHEPVAVAKAYAAAGATALSVLTEPEFFAGNVSYIKAIRAELPSMPILMKDFFCDDSQVYLARSVGADAILLIAAYLSAERIAQLHALAVKLGLSSLIEVHSCEELAKVPPAAEHHGALLVGVNTRDLKDLSISLDRFAPVAKTIRQQPALGDSAKLPLIAESGISCHDDLVSLTQQGADGFLVGSALMATADPGAALATLLGKDRA